MNLALFDLDNTILAGDSDYNWSRFLIQEGYLDGAIHAEKNEKFEGNSHLEEQRQQCLPTLIGAEQCPTITL